MVKIENIHLKCHHPSWVGIPFQVTKGLKSRKRRPRLHLARGVVTPAALLFLLNRKSIFPRNGLRYRSYFKKHPPKKRYNISPQRWAVNPHPKKTLDLRAILEPLKCFWDTPKCSGNFGKFFGNTELGKDSSKAKYKSWWHQFNLSTSKRIIFEISNSNTTFHFSLLLQIPCEKVFRYPKPTPKLLAEGIEA